MGFEVPAKENIARYEFKVAKGNITDQKQFDKSLILVKQDTHRRTLIQLPSFGTDYTWQVLYHTGRKASKSLLYHFSVDTSSMVDAQKYRVRILNNTYQDSTLLFSLDGTRTIYNMKGEPVWFLPAAGDYNKPGINLRDLKLSPHNTLTFLTGLGVYEVNINGDIKWYKDMMHIHGRSQEKVDKALRVDVRNLYHHEFTRLKNGHYVTLENEMAYRKLPPVDSSLVAKHPRVEKRDDGYYMAVELGKVVEYNEKGEVLWQWRSSEYFTDEEIFRIKAPNGFPFGITHLNAFYFNEDDSSVYIGFRDISHIVKIRYPGNEVIGSYGGRIHGSVDSFFSMQHSCSIDNNGNLCVFSNDQPPTNNEKRASSIVVLKGSGVEVSTLEKVWEFHCDIDTNAAPVSLRGGNVVGLADGCLLSCMGTSNRLFIVNKEKQVLFNAVVEKWNDEQKKWEVFPQYRTAPIYMSEYYNLLFQ